MGAKEDLTKAFDRNDLYIREILPEWLNNIYIQFVRQFSSMRGVEKGKVSESRKKFEIFVRYGIDTQEKLSFDSFRLALTLEESASELLSRRDYLVADRLQEFSEEIRAELGKRILFGLVRPYQNSGACVARHNDASDGLLRECFLASVGSFPEDSEDITSQVCHYALRDQAG